MAGAVAITKPAEGCRAALPARLHSGEADVIIAFLPDSPGNLSARFVATAHPLLAAPSGGLDVARLRTLRFVSYSAQLPYYGYQMKALEMMMKMEAVPARSGR